MTALNICVYIIIMKRVNYHLTEKQIKTLREISKDTGLSVAELIRRAIDAMYGKKMVMK